MTEDPHKDAVLAKPEHNSVTPTNASPMRSRKTGMT